MRKIWWLPVICIAVCVSQAIIAADSQDSATRKNSSTGRSRLLIFSRNKTPASESEMMQDEIEPRPANARVSRRDVDSEQTPVRRKPNGDTGTFSPKSSANKISVSVGKTRKVDFGEPVTRETTEELSDEEIRRMFEEESAAIRSAINQPPVKNNSIRGEDSTSGSGESETLDPEARRVARYKELLGSAPNGSVGNKSNSKRSIVPVSAEADDKVELEVNPFEPSERPTKVVNASWEEENGSTGSRHVKQASATTASRQIVDEKSFEQPEGKSDAKLTKSVPTKNSQFGKPSLGAKAKVTSRVVPAPTPTTKSIMPEAAFETTSESVVSSSTFNAAHSPQVDVQWEVRGEVTLGQECLCALLVHNRGKVIARDIIVEANFPESVQLVDAKPFPKGASQRLEWHFESMAAGEKKLIELTMVPTKRGELAASAQVRFTGTTATSFQVSEPMLVATVKMVEEVHLGEPASATLTISNPGTGTAQNVIVETVLPSGLASTSGKEISTELGPIGAGETRTVRLTLIAVKGGDQSIKFIARSSTADLEHATTAKINVLAPNLTLKASGPSLRYVNRTAKYLLTVTNNSSAASDNVRMTQTVDKGFEYVKADHGGQWDRQRRVVSWYLGHLNAGQSTTVELDLMPKETGEFQQQFQVVGDAGAQATADVTTRVEGAASLVMEVKDGDDPVEVGAETAVEIRLRNDGSKSAHKVAISLELPPEVELVKVDGPSQHLFESGMLIFKPMAELAAGDSATFVVYIKGNAAGTTKLRARLSSESIQKPLIVEEATQFY